MVKLHGYETLERIHEGKYTLVYRASSEKDGQRVIFKTINSDYPSPEIIARLKKEYDITSRFQNGGVIETLELVSAQNSPVIILEDFGAIALINILEQGPLVVGDFLSLAVRLANILGEIHAQNIIHKDINPANIVWNQEQDVVKIIDFGISLELSREVTGIKNPNMLEGTLAYISPEQTGRMNRFLDYRTDYYSLGVTFFRMLAGRLPFESMDSMELVYAHIARQAPLLHELDETIPLAVSDIIHKLMAKNVEDRYQSAGGLVADLEQCKREWSQTGGIQPFTPGREDVSNQFRIPQKLYGREEEIATLLGAFERASQGEKELMLVAGLPGIGKSALVNEIQKPIVRLRGNFIAGKYDKFEKDIPYSAMLRAFSGLVRHLLAEDEEPLARWKASIQQALGPNGRVLTDVIPELELVIGKQAAIPSLGPEESRNRFNLYFQFFMNVFCKAEHPLVLFLDDLQWADYASLKMIKLFLSDPDIKHFFVIGAFRANEVDETHPLSLILDEIQKTGTSIHSTDVTPLTLEAITELLCETLHRKADKTAPLAELLLRKTGGNPFFLGEFLKTLNQEQLLQFMPDSGWTWELRKIEDLQVTDNVVELMAGKIKSLPGDYGELLKLAACFGNYFKLQNMAEIAGKSEADTQKALNFLLDAGLLLKREINYNFAHDRIQEAAYSLIPEEEREKKHHRIGRLELERATKDDLPLKVFYIVNQLNAARSLIDSPEGRLELLELNLLAGKRARSSAAYRPALNYLDVALELLEADAWDTRYELTLSVHQEAINAAYLCSNFGRMEELGEIVISKARDVLDTVVVYEAKIFAAMAQNMLLEAVQIGLRILQSLGLNMPRNPGQVHIVLGLLSAKWALRGRTVESLANLPLLEDQRMLAIARILSDIGSSAYIAMPDLLPLIIFNTLKISVKFGNSEFSPYSAYATFGMVQCGILGNMSTGHRFGLLAADLLEKMNIKDSRGRTLFVIQFMVKGWKEHLRNTLPLFKEALRSAMETGDPEFIGHPAYAYVEYSFFCGAELAELEKENEQLKGVVGRHNQLFSLYSLRIQHQLLLNLLGHSQDPCILSGDAYDVDAFLPEHEEASDQNNLFRVNAYSGVLNYIFGRHEDALKYLTQAELYSESMLSTFGIPFLNFYKSLAQLALYPYVGTAKRRSFIRRVKRNQKKMKHWAESAPENFEHKFQLVEAEKARVLGLEKKAWNHYEKAILAARESQYINEEALALELFAKFWLDLGKDDFASLYMRKARKAYGTWGALAKVKALEDSFPELMHSLASDQSGSEDTVSTTGTFISGTAVTEHETTERSPGGKLDMNTVMKGSQAIAGEIVLGNLLRKMLKIVMENAGARSGFLILENNKKLFLEAAGDLDSDDVTVFQSLPLGEVSGLSPAIVQYVARTRETVVLNNAASAGQFAADAHIIENKPKSILCAPVLNQGKLSAILYLENNLSAGTFTADRLEVLNMLSSQIAVSIDNARLYGNLEEKVQERTSELRDTLDQVQELKDKQDGDYFLTSMLISPLGRNEVKSKSVTVEFLVKQNKQFNFKHWENELGGDICIAHSLILENTPHTVFLNADAMGKSMQGAGGALVLGAVFQSIIERTRLKTFDESKPADVWIKTVFDELQKVFESFDGSMLISVVLGTVNDETGVLQFINAEHPWTVLYREGQASFIEDDISLYKLGVPEQGDFIHIYRIQLKPGDVIIAGSDGRDDLLVSVGGQGEDGTNRVINSERRPFLKRVEEGEGELVHVKEALLRTGELMDDLSLLRLEFL